MQSNILVVDSVPQEMAQGTPAEFTRAQRRQAEKDAVRVAKNDTLAVTYGALPRILGNVFGPKLSSLAGGISEVSMSYLALIDCLVAKGLITIEDVQMSEQQLVKRMTEASKKTQEEAAKENENSPALQEARAKANEGAAVKRLVEVPWRDGEPTHVEEAVPAVSRLIEG